MNKGNPGFRLVILPLASWGLALLLAGCSVSLLPEKEPQRQFTLPYHYEAGQSASSAADALPALRINRPRASGLPGGKRIIVEKDPNERAAYGSVRWVTAAPELLQDHIVRALRADHRLGRVVSDASGSASEVTLSSSLQDFHEDRTGDQRRVRLYLQAQLVENGSRRPLATRDFEVSVPVDEDGIEASVAAFGRAADRLSGELADWLSDSLEDYSPED
ncbi:MAG: ABC-type transport auxiliary lipoprotein family protein [Marinobacter sp.]